jgi:intraflagellar transport protein 88
VRHQRYNAKALVTTGNCLFVKNECERAKELFLEAIGVEADCIEAIYNLGLVNIKIGVLNEALQAFEKLHSILPSNTEVLYQIANLHDLMGNYRQATKWFNILISCFTSNGGKNVADPGVLARVGQVSTLFRSLFYFASAMHESFLVCLSRFSIKTMTKHKHFTTIWSRIAIFQLI